MPVSLSPGHLGVFINKPGSMSTTVHTETKRTYVDYQETEFGADAGGYVMGLMHSHDDDEVK